MNTLKSSSTSFLLILFAFLGFFTTTTGCKSTKGAQSSSDVLPQALLWKIEGKDLKEASYLFGTIHMIDKSDFFLPVGFEDAFAKTDEVVFEIDMDDMTDMSSLMGLLSNLMMKDGVTLKTLLSPTEFKEVSDYFEEMGLPMFLVGRVKPMFLSMLAEVNMDPGQMESEEVVSYEMDLYDQANKVKKEVGGLETMAYQMSLFDSIPYKEQAKMLLDAVRSTTQDSDMMDETVDLYKSQNIEGMVAMMGEEDAAGVAGYEDVLLNNRNQNWIPVMAKLMPKHPVFFAVGAGHLGGPGGVIRLLRKEGYTVTPVSVYRPVSPKKF